MTNNDDAETHASECEVMNGDTETMISLLRDLQTTAEALDIKAKYIWALKGGVSALKAITKGND